MHLVCNFLHLRFIESYLKCLESVLFTSFSLFLWPKWNGEQKKTVLYILFYLTCWRECVPYYVKRNRFWRCFQANEGAWNGAWVKKCLFTRYLAACMPVFVTAVCVVFLWTPVNPISFIENKMHSPKTQIPTNSNRKR